MKLRLIFYYISTLVKSRLIFLLHFNIGGVGGICSPPLSSCPPISLTCLEGLGMENLKKITFKFNYGDSRVVRRVEKWGFG